MHAPQAQDFPQVTRLLLLRHAETAQPDIFHGAESDVGLSERGRRQAAAVAPILAAERPAVVISSAMRRAVETARPIAVACGAPHEIEPRLHERRVGTLSGTPANSSNDIWKATLAAWHAGDLSNAPAGAESFCDIQSRLLPVWEEISRRFGGRTVIVVAHGVLIRVLFISLFKQFQPFDWHSIGITNVAVNELHWDGHTWKLARQNEVVAETV